VAEVFAGFVVGYALALLATPFAALALIRARVRSATLARVVPEGTSLVALSVILHGFAFLAFTALGMVLGLVLMGLEDRSPDAGLGSPNQSFTAFILIVTGIAFLPPLAVLPRARLPLLASAVVFAAAFGWTMPYLSLLGPES
jgi:hypothetical protein